MLRKQTKAGSLANLFPSSEIVVSEVEKTLEGEHFRKEGMLTVDRDVDVEQEVLPCEYLCTYPWKQ